MTARGGLAGPDSRADPHQSRRRFPGRRVSSAARHAVPCTVDQLSNVTAVKIYVLVRSREPTPGYTDTKTYTLGGTTLGPFNDEFKRHVYVQHGSPAEHRRPEADAMTRSNPRRRAWRRPRRRADHAGADHADADRRAQPRHRRISGPSATCSSARKPSRPRTGRSTGHRRPISSNPPAAQDIAVDIDNDGTDDYVVQIARAAVRLRAAPRRSRRPEQYLRPGLTAASTWNTVWDIQATVDPAGNVGGAAVVVHAGVRVLLDAGPEGRPCAHEMHESIRSTNMKRFLNASCGRSPCLSLTRRPGRRTSTCSSSRPASRLDCRTS